MPGKTRVRLRTNRTSIPFAFAPDGSSGATPPSSRLWTPGGGPSGLQRAW
jgi:hypothetical protein